jgi:hypothetical protein
MRHDQRWYYRVERDYTNLTRLESLESDVKRINDGDNTNNGNLVITSIFYLESSSGCDHGEVPLLLTCRGRTPTKLTKGQRRWARTSSNRKQRTGPRAGLLGTCPYVRSRVWSAAVGWGQGGGARQRRRGSGMAATHKENTGQLQTEELPWWSRRKRRRKDGESTKRAWIWENKYTTV